MLRRDKEWLEASIQKCERILQVVVKRLELLRGLRAELDVDLVDLLRELDGAVVEDSSQKVDTKEQGNSPREEVASVVDDDKDKLTREVVVSESAAANKKNEDGKVDAVKARQQRSERQVRGDQNPNRLMILKLTRERAMTVPSLERELSARIGRISKQSVDNWVKKLLDEGLLLREDSPDPAAKYQYRRSDIPDAAEDAEQRQPEILGAMT